MGFCEFSSQGENIPLMVLEEEPREASTLEIRGGFIHHWDSSVFWKHLGRAREDSQCL